MKDEIMSHGRYVLCCLRSCFFQSDSNRVHWNGHYISRLDAHSPWFVLSINSQYQPLRILISSGWPVGCGSLMAHSHKGVALWDPPGPTRGTQQSSALCPGSCFAKETGAEAGHQNEGHCEEGNVLRQVGSFAWAQHERSWWEVKIRIMPWSLSWPVLICIFAR